MQEFFGFVYDQLFLSLNAAPVVLTQNPYIIICRACSFFTPITKLQTPATTGCVPGDSFLEIFSEYSLRKSLEDMDSDAFEHL